MGAIGDKLLSNLAAGEAKFQNSSLELRQTEEANAAAPLGACRHHNELWKTTAAAILATEVRR